MGAKVSTPASSDDRNRMSSTHRRNGLKSIRMPCFGFHHRGGSFLRMPFDSSLSSKSGVSQSLPVGIGEHVKDGGHKYRDRFDGNINRSDESSFIFRTSAKKGLNSVTMSESPSCLNPKTAIARTGHGKLIGKVIGAKKLDDLVSICSEAEQNEFLEENLLHKCAPIGTREVDTDSELFDVDASTISSLESDGHDLHVPPKAMESDAAWRDENQWLVKPANMMKEFIQRKFDAESHLKQAKSSKQLDTSACVAEFAQQEAPIKHMKHDSGLENALDIHSRRYPANENNAGASGKATQSSYSSKRSLLSLRPNKLEVKKCSISPRTPNIETSGYARNIPVGSTGMNQTNGGEEPASRALASPPHIFYFEGLKVTEVDSHFKVFVIDLIPPSVCDLILRLTDLHLKRVTERNDIKRAWRSLYTYTKMDLPCCEVDGLPDLTDRIMASIKLILGVIFGDHRAAHSLRPRSWKEPHLLRYEVVLGKPHHAGVEMHYDGSHFTWQLMLSEETEYEGKDVLAGNIQYESHTYFLFIFVCRWRYVY